MAKRTDLLGDDLDLLETERLFLSLFPKEEKLFFEFLEENPDYKKANWRHIWYYRFLQISPSYNFLLKMIDDYNDKAEQNFEIDFGAEDSDYEDDEYLSEEDLEKKQEIRGRKRAERRSRIKSQWFLTNIDSDNFCKNISPSYHKNIRALLKTYRLNGDIRNKTLKEWWINNGQFIFETIAASRIEIIANIKHNHTFRKFNQSLESFNNFMEDSHIFKQNHSLVVGMTINNSKEGMMKIFSDFLDDTINFDEEQKKEIHLTINDDIGNEKKFYSYFRTLYYRYEYPSLTLKELAKKANILKTSQHGSDGSRSTESGISRILRESKFLAENTAFGNYPEFEEGPDNLKIDSSNFLSKENFDRVFELSEWSVNNPQYISMLEGLVDSLRYLPVPDLN
jgi:hypothetical protein